MLKKIAQLIASLGGIGFLPWAPGTIGSLAAVLLLCSFPALSLSAHVGLIASALVLGLAVTQYATGGKGDPSWVVVDELVGMWLALLGAPHTLLAFMLAFALFRLLDVTKPLGISFLERLPGAWGVMLDDLAAGLLTLLLLQAFFYIKPF